MRNFQFYLCTTLAGLCLLLSLYLVYQGAGNQKLQAENGAKSEELRKQVEQINAGNVIAQQIGPNLVRDLALAAADNGRIKELLAKHGYTISYQGTPAPAAATPEPVR